MSKLEAIRFTLMPFGVLAVFCATILGFDAFTQLAGLWYEPVTGFMAAIVVVVTGYIFAPKYKIVFAVIWFFIGAVIAWDLLIDAHYPEKFGRNYAYYPTYIPLAMTYLGGAIGLVICYRVESKRREKEMN